MHRSADLNSSGDDEGVVPVHKAGGAESGGGADIVALSKVAASQGQMAAPMQVWRGNLLPMLRGALPRLTSSAWAFCYGVQLCLCSAALHDSLLPGYVARLCSRTSRMQLGQRRC